MTNISQFSIETKVCSNDYLTLFRSGGYQIDTCLPFSLYLLHGFHSESEQPDQNRVKLPDFTMFGPNLVCYMS